MPTSVLHRSTRARRRRWPAPLTWIGLAALVVLMVLIGSGLIPSEVGQNGTPDVFVPRVVDTTQGWGTPKAYTGRYAIRQVSPKDATGSLVLFLRAENPGDPLVASGMLTLNVSGRNVLGYLTEMHVQAGRVRANVRGGTFQGPVIGSVTGTTQGRGKFHGTVRVAGAPTVDGSFVRVAAVSDDYTQQQDLNLP